MIKPARTVAFALVWWDDAHSPAATDCYNIEEAQRLAKPLPILTAGWVMSDDERGVVLANEYCDDGDFRGFTTILRPLVREVQHVRLTAAPRKKPDPPASG